MYRIVLLGFALLLLGTAPPALAAAGPVEDVDVPVHCVWTSAPSSNYVFGCYVFDPREPRPEPEDWEKEVVVYCWRWSNTDLECNGALALDTEP